MDTSQLDDKVSYLYLLENNYDANGEFGTDGKLHVSYMYKKSSSYALDDGVLSRTYLTFANQALEDLIKNRYLSNSDHLIYTKYRYEGFPSDQWKDLEYFIYKNGYNPNLGYKTVLVESVRVVLTGNGVKIKPAN